MAWAGANTLRMRSVVLQVIVLQLGAMATSAAARSIDLDPPGPREFILDRAGLIEAPDAEQIGARCDKLLTETATPIVVVTIESMATYSKYGDMRIETFAHLLFDQWEIGHVDVAGTEHNRGILLLVSRDDRKARIQLGAGWGATAESESRRIMDQQIVPEFKKGRFNRGIADGVAALDDMVRQPQPRPSAGAARAPPQPPAPADAARERIAPPMQYVEDEPRGRRSVGAPGGNFTCGMGACGAGLLAIIAGLARIFGGSMYGLGGGRRGGWFGPYGGWGPGMGLGGGGFRGGGFRGGGFSGGGSRGGGFSGGGGGGGFSGGSFGGGFSGGRGASGSW